MFLRRAATVLHRRIPFPSQTIAASHHAKIASVFATSLSSKMEYLNQYGSKGFTWRWHHKDNWLWFFFLYLWTCRPKKKNKVYVHEISNYGSLHRVLCQRLVGCGKSSLIFELSSRKWVWGALSFLFVYSSRMCMYTSYVFCFIIFLVFFNFYPENFIFKILILR